MEPAIIDTQTFLCSSNYNVQQKLRSYRTIYGFVNLSIVTYEEVVNKLRYEDFKYLLKNSRAYLNFNQVIPITKEITQLAENLYTEFKQKGVEIKFSDLLVAATALKHNLTLITNNKKLIEYIPGLQVDKWTLY